MTNRLATGMHHCPSHPDNSPSLSITRASDGRWLLHCHAGCSVPEILDAYGLTWADVFPEDSRPAARPIRYVPPKHSTLDPDALRAVLDEEARHAARRETYAAEWAIASRIRTLRRRADLVRRFAARTTEEDERGWTLRALAANLDTQAHDLEMELDEALGG